MRSETDGHVGTQRTHWRRILRDDARHQGEGIAVASVLKAPSGEGREEGGANGIDVGASVEGLALDLFGRAYTGCHERPGARQFRLGMQRTGQTKVADLDAPPLSRSSWRLDVAVG